MVKSKSFEISKWKVAEAFDLVKSKKGTYGIDEQSIEDYEKDLKKNLYKLWNHMSSGAYFPKPVKAVSIPKKSGGTRILGIPTVEDRIAQMVARLYLEETVEPIFLEDSYGYRPNKSALQAVAVTRMRCWKRDWVLEFDIKGLFDNIRHDYLLEMVRRHTKEPWILLYVKRWLETPFQHEDGRIQERISGTPQGGVISPLLANLYMHYAFDTYIETLNNQSLFWCRYADDGLINCYSLKQAEFIKRKLVVRFQKFGLELHPTKTRIVYCKMDGRNKSFRLITFDFLGFQFRPRGARRKDGTMFINYLPAISENAKKSIRDEIRHWKLQLKSDKSIRDLSNMFNPKIQGWINYYTKFYPSEMEDIFNYIDLSLVKWVRRKYKKKNSQKKAREWLKQIEKRDSALFAHWKFRESKRL